MVVELVKIEAAQALSLLQITLAQLAMNELAHSPSEQVSVSPSTILPL